MKDTLFWDCEANGLLSDVSSIHCISFKTMREQRVWTLSKETLTKENILLAFSNIEKIVCHNEIGYDLPLLNQMYGIDLIKTLGKEAIVDTLILSQVLNPDRELPKGCPTTIRNLVTGRGKLVGPHGLESWGWRVGNKKIEIHDWRIFTPEMIERCEMDVLINEKVYYALMKEADLEVL
jgi:hypothetical protein